VHDLDKAVAFYRDGLGFDVPDQPTDATTNAPLRDMFGLPDARMRWLIGRATGIAGGIEIVEISGAKASTLKRALQDPGAVTLVLTVRDLDAIAARLHEQNVRVLTPGKVPALVTMGGAQARVLTVQDPDGHFVELIQPPEIAATAVPPTANIIDARVRQTVQSLDRAVQLYHDALGLALINRSEFTSEHAVATALGVPGARLRMATLQVPQSGLILEVIEFAGKHRSARANIQDPGSTRMQLRVRNVDEAIAAIAKFGGEVISTGGKSVELPAGNNKITVAIDREPDNLFIVMLGAPAPR
jgi:catechol 2,3-dioxygenase-like lactoylglutathione lyase family enzyme